MATFALLVAARRAGVRRLVYAASSSAYGDQPTLPKIEEMRPEPSEPLRGGQARRRVLLSGLDARLRLRDGLPPLLQRLRPAPRPQLAVLGRHLALHLGAGCRASAPSSTATASSRATSPTSPTSWTGTCAPPRRGRAVGRVINVATGRRTTLNELLDALKKITGRTEVEAEYREPRIGDVRHSLADITRARELLGYEPRIDLEEGLRHTLEWWKQSRFADK